MMFVGKILAIWVALSAVAVAGFGALSLRQTN